MAYRVYWTNAEQNPCSSDFDSTDISGMLAYTELLRKDPYNSFITSVSQNPNSVGKPGVSSPPADYSWTKRRYNERRIHPVVSTDMIEVPVDEE